MTLTFRQFQATRRTSDDVCADVVDPAPHIVGDAGYVYLDRFGIAEWFTSDDVDAAPAYLLAHGETEARYPTLEEAEVALYERFVRGE